MNSVTGFLESALFSIGEGVIAIDSNHQLVFFNDAALGALGIRARPQPRLSFSELTNEKTVLDAF